MFASLAKKGKVALFNIMDVALGLAGLVQTDEYDLDVTDVRGHDLVWAGAELGSRREAAEVVSDAVVGAYRPGAGDDVRFVYVVHTHLLCLEHSVVVLD